MQQLPCLAIAHPQNQYKRRRKEALISKPRGPWPHHGRCGGPGARMRRRPPGSGPGGATGSRGRNEQRSRPVRPRAGTQKICFVGCRSPRAPGRPTHARAGRGPGGRQRTCRHQVNKTHFLCAGMWGRAGGGRRTLSSPPVRLRLSSSAAPVLLLGGYYDTPPGEMCDV